MKEVLRNLFQEKLRYDSCKMTMTSFHSNKSLGIRAILRNDFIKAQELNTKPQTKEIMLVRVYSLSRLITMLQG